MQRPTKYTSTSTREKAVDTEKAFKGFFILVLIWKGMDPDPILEEKERKQLDPDPTFEVHRIDRFKDFFFLNNN